MANLNLLEVYQRAFGYKGIPRIGLAQTAIVPESSALNDIETVKDFSGDTDFSKQNSFLGTPYFMPCKIFGIQLPNEPVITIKGSKTIIETPIDGNEGTFKEHYALGDYGITIQGVCVLEENSDEYPEAQVRSLRRIIEEKTGLDVVCKLLSYFDIKHLAIKSFDFPSIEGAPGMQPYTLECASDKYFDLELLDG